MYYTRVLRKLNGINPNEAWAMADILCPTKSDIKFGKKIPSAMTKTRLPSLIVAPSHLIPMWQKEFAKTVLPGVLDLRTSHLGQYANLGDLFNH